MTKKILVLLVSCFTVMELFSKDIISEIKFKKMVVGPALVVTCEYKIWTYSVGDNRFTLFSAKGEIFKSYKVASFGDIPKVTALACSDQGVLFAGLDKNDKAQLFLMSGERVKNLNYKIEEPGHIRNISCYKKSCVVVHQNIYISLDFSRWLKIEAPGSSKIPLIGAEGDSAAFANWQDKFEITKDEYSRAIISEKGELFLLDPFKVKVVNVGYVAEDGTFSLGAKFIKWGKWGTWEGQLMYPKAIKYWGRHDLFVISDVGLKNVFFFGTDGKYFGKLGEEEAKGLVYPIDFALDDDSLYITDFLANTILGVDLQKFEKRADVASKKIENYFQRNLFKDPKINEGFSNTRCLNCHDGLEIYSLDNFVKEKSHHPTEIEAKYGVDLPLWLGKYISCATCHTQHHVPQNASSYIKNGKEEKGEKLPHNLRREYRLLCITCHGDKIDSKTNHINLNMDMRSEKVKSTQVTTCSQCHAMHRASDKLLAFPDSQVCSSCHGAGQTPVIHPFGAVTVCMTCHNPEKRPSTHPVLPETHLADQTANKKIQCFSCHKLHNSNKSDNFPRADEKGRDWSCMNCHQSFVPHLNTNPHLVAYSKTEVACLRCHNPHEKTAKNVVALCTRCHVDRKAQHKKFPAMESYGAGNIRLQNSEIVCSTCHQQHGFSRNEKFLKDREAISLFCASCHGGEAPKMFENFHNKLKR